MTTSILHGTPEWHAARLRTVGSSEVAALFGCSPYDTPFSLWHRKRGAIAAADLGDNRRVRAGMKFEDAIAELVAEGAGLEIRKVREYRLSERVEGMGASLDFEAIEDGAAVPLEIKNVAQSEWHKWAGDGEIDPPAHIGLQVQHQLAVTGAPHAYIGVLVGGWDAKLVRQERHATVIAQIEAKIAAFWRSIADGEEPAPDYGRDLDAMELVRLACAPGAVDLTGNERVERLMERYRHAKATERAAAADAEAARAELLDCIGAAEEAFCRGGKIKTKRLAAEAEREETRTVKAKPERREIRVYPKKQKEL